MYPVIFENIEKSYKITTKKSVQNKLELFKSTGWRLFINVLVLPLPVSLNEKMARTRITVYATSLRWLYKFINIYQRIPPFPFTRKLNVPDSKDRNRLLDHLDSISIDRVCLSGM